MKLPSQYLLFIVATNLVANRPSEYRPTRTPHARANKREFRKLHLKVHEMVATKYQEKADQVAMLGLWDKALVENEIKLPEADIKMQLVAYRHTIYYLSPYHIISHVERCLLSEL